MARKKKQKLEGAPDWMVTYGDMMTLLLCFFVILVSMSELKQDQRFQKVMESIKRAFGYTGGLGFIPAQNTPANSLESKLRELVVAKAELREGKSRDEGIEGQNPSVKAIRDGLEFKMGGRLVFEPGRARLLESGRKQLVSFCDVLRGYNWKIRVRGHASPKPKELYAPFADLDELSFARAVAVKKCLIDNGIRAERITVEACGANEPLRAQAYDAASKTLNRRVSIIVTENLVENYIGRPASQDEGAIK